MHRKHRVIATLALMLTLLFCSVATVCATGTGNTSIAVSKSNLEVGDTLTVTIQAPASDTFTISFNGSILTLTNCSASGYTTSGSSVSYTGQNATLSFKAATSGTSYISVKPNTLTGCSTNVSVAEAAVQEETDTNTQDTTTEQAQDTTASGDFEVDGTQYVVSERFSDSEIPAGFEKTEITINDSEYTELSNGMITLVYLKPASDTSSAGTFYIYSADSNSVSPCKMLGSTEDYVIIQTPEELPSSLFTEATFTVSEVEYSGYALSGYEEDGFYFVYGMDENQNQGWYQYNSEDGTVQMLNTDMLSLVSSTEDTDDGNTGSAASKLLNRFKNSRSAIAILIFVIVVLVIITINIRVFKAKNDEVFDEEAEDDSEEELEEVEDAPKMTRKERRLAKKAAKAEKESLTMEDSQNPEVTSEDIEEPEDDDFEEEGGFFSRLFRKEEDVFAEDDTTGTIFDDDMSIANPVKENPVKEDTKNDKEDRRDNGDFDIMDLNDL